MKLPIGYFENEDSGRIRRKIDDNASKTHSFIAHIMPDMASAVVVPILMIVLILVVDIKLDYLPTGYCLRHGKYVYDDGT